MLSMRRFLVIALWSVLAACSAPDEPGAADAGLSVEVGRPDGDASVTLETGELLSDFGDMDAEEYLLRDAGEFLFVFGDGRELGWLRKSEGTLISFADWPDTDHQEAGRGSPDYVFDDERVWFVAEMGDGTSALVGAAHDLGNPFPFFGQPIVIIDAGPRTGPRGIALHQNRLVAVFEDRSIVVATEEGGIVDTLEAPAPPMFDRIDTGPEGIALWTKDDGAGATLRAFTPEQDFTTLAEPGDEPIAASIHAGGYVWVTRDGDVVERPSGDASARVVMEGGVPVDAEAQVAASGEAIAAAAGDSIRLIVGERITDIDAEGEVHSLIVDSSSIYWSTTDGVYRYDVTP
jgi:hypothetical protein